MTKEAEIQAIDKKIMMVSIMDAPGSILVGLALYSKFATNGDAFHPLLNDPDVVNSMIVLGGVIMAWGAYKILTLSQAKRKLAKML
jgi:hypothetical protein